MSEPTDILALIDERLNAPRPRTAVTNLCDTDRDLIALRKAREALRAVLDLHQPHRACSSHPCNSPEPDCPGCTEWCIECGATFPCQTVLAVTEALGAGDE